MQDGMYTLSEMECMGSCVNAPMIAVADYSGPDARSFKYTYYEDLTPQDALSIMDDLKAGKTPRVGALCCIQALYVYAASQAYSVMLIRLCMGFISLCACCVILSLQTLLILRSAV